MGTIFLQTLAQTLRLLGLAAIGYYFNKKHVLPEGAGKTLSAITTKLFLPMLSLSTFIKNCTVQSLTANVSLVLYGALTIGLSMVLAYLLAPRFGGGDKYQEGIYRYSLTIPNTGAFATTITLSLLGSEGLYQQSLYGIALNFLCYSWGIVQLQKQAVKGDWKSSLKRVFSLPVIAMLTGAVLGLLGGAKWIPEVAINTFTGLGNCYIYVAVIVIGYSVADFSLKELLPEKKTLYFSLLRLLLIPLALLFLMKLIHAPYWAGYFTAAYFCCPCGMNTIIFPLSYGEDCREAVRIVGFTSLAAIVTIPFVYAVAAAIL